MAASTTTYVIFMVAIVLFVTPALFALAQQLLQIIIGVTSSLGASTGGGGAGIGGMSIGSSGIDPGDFKTFALLAVGLIATFSAMIVSIISKGNIKGGIKNIPLFIAVSTVLFLLISNVLANFFVSIA